MVWDLPYHFSHPDGANLMHEEHLWECRASANSLCLFKTSRSRTFSSHGSHQYVRDDTSVGPMGLAYGAGYRAAMTMWKAERLCGELIVLVALISSSNPSML